MELVKYMPDCWRVDDGFQIAGWIDLEGGKFNARAPHKGGHKGGLSASLGTRDTLEEAKLLVEDNHIPQP